jgi:multidrug efflux system membrane fusion protein
VEAVARKDVPLDIQVIGNVEAYSTISVRSQITGPLATVHFREGDYVRKGDRLFTIDPSPFDASVRGAEGDLAKSEAQLAQAQATLKRDIAQSKYAQAQATRYTELFRKGIMSRDQTEQMQSGADALSEGLPADEASIKSAEAAVIGAQAALANAKIQLGYTKIQSPIEGRTGNLAVKTGNLVNANSQELITINQIQPIYVTFSVPEAHLPAIKQRMAGGKLAVFAAPQDAAAGRPDTGVLTFVDNAVDTSTGTIKLKGTFANPERTLWPGQFVRVTLRLATQSNALVVPSQAVQSGQEGPFVYVVQPDKAVESRPVTPGPRVGQDILIETGLKAGEVVVTEGQLRLAPGMKVRIRDRKEGPANGKEGRASK